MNGLVHGDRSKSVDAVEELLKVPTAKLLAKDHGLSHQQTGVPSPTKGLRGLSGHRPADDCVKQGCRNRGRVRRLLRALRSRKRANQTPDLLTHSETDVIVENEVNTSPPPGSGRLSSASDHVVRGLREEMTDDR